MPELLDFQDALVGSHAYDLVSLLQDARVDVPAALEDELLAYYLERRAADTAFDGDAFRFAYAALGVQPRSELAAQAGARFDKERRLYVDEHQQTSVPGLYAAGDLVRGLNQISTAQGEAAIAATAIHNRLRGA